MSEKETKSNGQDALSIITDEKYDMRKNPNVENNETAESGFSRRDVLKYGGATAAALSIAGSAATGFNTGRSAEGYTGFGRTFLGKDQFFNREPFRADVAAMMEPVAEVTRADWSDYYLRRWKGVNALIRAKKWNPKDGVEAMPGKYGEFFRANPEMYENLLFINENVAKQARYLQSGEGYDRYAITNAYTTAYNRSSVTRFGYSLPEDPTDEYRITGKIVTPEEWDFRYVKKNRKKLEFKTPRHASEFIKKMTHLFGASFAAVTDFDPAFMYKNVMRGYPDLGIDYGDKVPEHWKSMIVFAYPQEWDAVQSQYTSAQDGYFRVRITAALLERFIQEIGYASRAQTPVTTYEVMITPFVMKSGLGEYARAGYAMIPEVGSNFRSAGVITNIEFEYDKPININMANFCKKCKICADTCPSGAIETTDEPTQVVRGFKRWVLDQEKCHRGWVTTPIYGCATCLGVCPFTRKNTWIHAISREADARDVTGIFGTLLLAMQQNFFKYPNAEEFLSVENGGLNAAYHDPVDWMRTEDWFSNVVKEWDYDGMH